MTERNPQPPKAAWQYSLAGAVVFMGFGHIILRRYAKGILYMSVEIAVLFFCFFQVLPSGISLTGSGPLVQAVAKMISLGGDQSMLPIREREHSMFLLINGLAALIILGFFAALYISSIRETGNLSRIYKVSKKLLPARSCLSSFTGNVFPALALAPTLVLLAFFVLLPLLFSALIAFTNYSAPNNIPPANRVNWVGFGNFITLFSGGGAWSASLGRVVLWNCIWAFFSTITTYFGGLMVTLALRSQNIKIAPVFRTLFMLPYAVPGLISLMVWVNLLNGTFGPINTLLKQTGLIERNIPWLTDPAYAKMTMIMVNFWLGFPYHMLMTTSIITSISPDLFEAASIDGATQWQVIRRITVPLVLRQTVPLIIMSFSANFNNFGMAYFLTSGGPGIAGETAITKAGSTDIIISWIYKLTTDTPQKYQYASVMAIMVFLVLAPFAVYNYTRTKSFKEADIS